MFWVYIELFRGKKSLIQLIRGVLGSGHANCLDIFTKLQKYAAIWPLYCVFFGVKRALFTGINGESEKARTISGDAHQLRVLLFMVSILGLKRAIYGLKTPIFGTLISNNEQVGVALGQSNNLDWWNNEKRNENEIVHENNLSSSIGILINDGMCN